MESGAPADGTSSREEDVSSTGAACVSVGSVITVDETFQGTREVVLKKRMLRVAVLAVHDTVRLGTGDVADEMFEFIPVYRSRVNLVTTETVEREGDVRSCALFEVAQGTDDLAEGNLRHGVLLALFNGALFFGEMCARARSCNGS